MTALITQLEAPPELLSPAGNWDCAVAAVENGADAIYFGLDHGFNARARAQNFASEQLDPLMAMLHERGVCGYVTLNTLVFASELAGLAKTVERIASAGVDAVLVQDIGVARLIRRICPELEIHASTQMTMTSAETIAVAMDLGVSRVVLARELSVGEIQKIRAATTMPLEVFIHGALCVAYSGQCLTSESLGGRSANRGQCAQACRLPYELVCDGEDRDFGDVRYLLSPQDLAGYAQIPELIEAGVCSLKIEGRLKTPEYVANITSHYRKSIDEAWATGKVTLSTDQVREMEMSFSRGFTPGWLEGNDHKRLVPGTESAKRGVLVGEVLAKRDGRVRITLDGPIRRGDGVAFDGDRVSGRQQGGRIYDIIRGGQSVESCDAGDVELIFGPGAIDSSQIPDAGRVWKNDDPLLNKRLRQTFSGRDPVRRLPVDLVVRAVVGRPLEVTATVAGDLDLGDRPAVTVHSEQPLEAARNRPVTTESLEEQLGRLGGTTFRLGTLVPEIVGGPMVPASLLNQLRRQWVSELTRQLSTPRVRTIHRDALAEMLHVCGRSSHAADVDPIEAWVPSLRVLCRTIDQVRAATESGVDRIYVDFHDIRRYRDAVDVARSAGVEIFVAAVRIQKPGENGLMRVLTRLAADGYLIRNFAALDFFIRSGKRVVGDFSLNVVNPLSAHWLVQRGCEAITPSYDLNRDQLIELVDATDASRLEVVVHQHMPMFHMEHCVFCSVLSPGTNKTNCGRPCDRHVVQLRDRVGAEHPLHADVACRNTLYNAVPQSGAEVVPALSVRGVGAIRMELLEQTQRESQQVIEIYRDLLGGRIDGREVWKRLSASNRVGVTRGTLEAARNPLAIL